ncbi:RPA-C domain-containing protein [Mycena kentingensis (nom. inval.)]|nr:RPA-C domain-containing protein [Mycena kentingensis (nom. inval.)]
MSQYSPSHGGGFSASQGGASPGQKAAQTVRPVTIAQLRKASQMHSDAEWKLNDQPLGQITLVAEARDPKVHSTNRGFTLDDGTASMTAKIWVDTATDEEDKPWRGMNMQHFIPTYVRVTGSLRFHSGRKYIHISNLRVVEDKNEIYYHIMDTIYAHIVLQKGLPTEGTAQSGQQQQQASTSGGQSAYTIQSRLNAKKLFSPLADRVAHYLATHQTESEGANVGEIAAALQCDAIELSEAVERLIDEGHIYTTIDDSHIQLAD